MLNAVIVITSRWNSTRFPGKALHEFREKPLLRHLIDTVDKLWTKDGPYSIIATTSESTPIVRYCLDVGITFNIGDNENDILGRLLQASKGRDYVIRLWGDAPFIHEDDIRKAIALYDDTPQRYLALKTEHGEYIAICKRSLLEELDALNLPPSDREWIHKYMSSLPGYVEHVEPQVDCNVIDTKEQLVDYASRNPA